MTRRWIILLIVVLWRATAMAAPAAWWAPEPGIRFDYQISGKIKLEQPVDLIDVDLVETTAETVRNLQRDGTRVACYISVGSWESWRPDAQRFPAEVLGKDYDGWKGERWLDIRRIDLLGPILGARLDSCRDKGFDAVEPDNVEGHDNDTGFAISADDQLAFNRWLAREAHARGLSIGLKNDGSQAAELVKDFDWALVEECFAYDECQLYLPFKDEGKAVFVVEYTKKKKRQKEACAANLDYGFGLIFKKLKLDSWIRHCD